MAVSITQQPDTHTPSDNPVRWVFSSDQFAQANFSFLVEIYINGVLKSQHYPIFPEINSDTVHFDASEIAMLYCSPPAPQIPSGGNISVDAANDCEVGIKVIERYGDPVTNHASAENTVHVFKAKLGKRDFAQYSELTYKWYFPGPPREAPKFMTLFPRTSKYLCGMDEQAFLLFMSEFNDLTLNIELFTRTGSLIVSDTCTTVCATSEFTLFNVSPSNIISSSDIELANFAGCSYYEVWLTDGTDLSERFRIYIDRSCDRYGKTRMHFLQSLGGIDSFTFNKSKTHDTDITRSEHRAEWGAYNEDVEYVYTENQPTIQDHLTSSTSKASQSSDWVTEGIQQYISSELFRSPYVLIEYIDDNDVVQFKRIKLLNSKISKEYRVRKPRFQLTVEYDPAEEYISARV